MTFKPLSYLENAVKSKDIKYIRISLIGYIKKCLGDTDEIIQAVSYIEESLTPLEFDRIWEKHNGLKLDSNKSNWNKTYFSSVEFDLEDNFSKERFNHILEVGRHVYGTTKPTNLMERKGTNNNRKAKISSSISKEDNDNFLQIALIAGAIILLGIPLLVKMMKK